MTPYKRLFESQEMRDLYDYEKNTTGHHDFVNEIAKDLINYCNGDTSKFDDSVTDEDFLKSYDVEDQDYILRHSGEIAQTAWDNSDEVLSEAILSKRLSPHEIALDLIDFCGGDSSEIESAIDNRGFLRSYNDEQKKFIKDKKSEILQTALEYAEEGEVE
jgi:hypothetical protein